MTPPIDLLAVAARLHFAAWQALEDAKLLNVSPQATFNYSHATIAFDLANRDLAAAEWLARELG